MRHSLSFIKSFIIVLLITTGLGSCFISSHSDMEVFNKNEYANSVSVKTIKVPLILTTPILKKYLGYEEKVPAEILHIAKSIKKVKVTLANTTNQDLIRDFHSAVSAYKGDEWFSIHQGTQWTYLKVEQDKNNITNGLMVAVSNPNADQLVFVNIKCHLTTAQLSTLVNFALEGEVSKELVRK